MGRRTLSTIVNKASGKRVRPPDVVEAISVGDGVDEDETVRPQDGVRQGHLGVVLRKQEHKHGKSPQFACRRPASLGGVTDAGRTPYAITHLTI